jgi:hypothetical protein
MRQAPGVPAKFNDASQPLARRCDILLKRVIGYGAMPETAGVAVHRRAVTPFRRRHVAGIAADALPGLLAAPLSPCRCWRKPLAWSFDPINTRNHGNFATRGLGRCFLVTE